MTRKTLDPNDPCYSVHRKSIGGGMYSAVHPMSSGHNVTFHYKGSVISERVSNLRRAELATRQDPAVNHVLKSWPLDLHCAARLSHSVNTRIGRGIPSGWEL